MSSVAVNPPKTPVTKGSNGMATATLPNMCKMPPPPPPFCPTPLPNIGMSGKNPQKYSTTVKIEGNPVAIQGSTFDSTGDIASKGTGGGVVSNNAEGPTAFVAPGSLDVKIEGKNVQFLGDQMLNNCGPAGSPANSATMGGVLQGPVIVQAKAAGVLAEVQEICDTICECKAEKNTNQNCVAKKLNNKDKKSGYKRKVKPEVPFDMKGKSPKPFMSANDPRRASTNWFRPHRRPDVIVISALAKPWSGDNIAAVVECKLGKDDWRPGQRAAYEKIAGGKKKVIELNDKNCKCK